MDIWKKSGQRSDNFSLNDHTPFDALIFSSSRPWDIDNFSPRQKKKRKDLSLVLIV